MESSGEKRPITASFQSAEEHHDLCNRKLSLLGRFPKRNVVGIMAFFGFCNIYALRANLSIAIVAMVAKYNVTNESRTLIEPGFDWTPRQQGLILGAFFYGYIFTQIPGGFLANRFGGKFLFGGGVFITAVLTILTPFCAQQNIALLVTVRVLEGLCEGVTYPSVHAIWAKWAPPMEKTRLAAFAFSGSYIGTVLAMLISGGLFSAGYNWQSIFYLFGSFGVLWFVSWCFLIAESPAKHSTITDAELDYIQSSIGYTDEQTQNILPPWFDILRSPALWAIVAAHFAENWGFYTWLTELPSFMKYALNFDLQNAGYLTALPYFVMGLVVMSCGFLADFLLARVQISVVAVRKMFTCGAFLSQMVFMVAAGYVMTPVAAVVCLTIAVGLGGFAWGGFSVNHLDIAPQYASILMGISNTFATIPGIVSPGLTGVIVSDQHDKGEWQVVFYLAAGIYLAGCVIFGLFASGHRQAWAEVPTGYMSQVDENSRDDL
uniref:Sialin n=1 Tax=Crassostrea virginica TaxID=6565 RepID=A0A8B8DM08_CRAVI|nr:sialin-like [Crassostrea virginica]XP_022328031.1 sialin-like [Crassostrea virginica]